LKKSIAFILAAAFLFGTMEVALKLAGSAFDPLQLTFLRFMIGGICLLPFAIHDIRRRGCRLDAGDWVYLFLLGFVNVCISMVLFQVGLKWMDANLSAVVISTNPVFTMVFARVFLGEAFTARKAGVLALSIIGLVIVANPPALMSGASDMRGIALTLGAAVMFGLYSALGKKRVAKIGGFAQNSLSFILGSAALFPVLLLTNRPVVAGIELSSLPVLLYLGVCVTALGYCCYLKAIELSGPSTASMAFFIKPVIAPIIAFAVLGEPVTANLAVGIGFVLAGSLLGFAKGTPKADDAACTAASGRFECLDDGAA
jgi:drug/metabolite transporter (DMT)-like permease